MTLLSHLYSKLRPSTVAFISVGKAVRQQFRSRRDFVSHHQLSFTKQFRGLNCCFIFSRRKMTFSWRAVLNLTKEVLNWKSSFVWVTLSCSLWREKAEETNQLLTKRCVLSVTHVLEHYSLEWQQDLSWPSLGCYHHDYSLLLHWKSNNPRQARETVRPVLCANRCLSLGRASE